MPDAQNCPHELADERLITRRQLQQILPVSTTTIWRLEKSGCFPKHVTIGGLNFWRGTEVREYLSRTS
jgi:predicted DNA-binding transcriptional regulator AlpA